MMKVLRIGKNPLFHKKLKSKRTECGVVPQPLGRPIFPFVGNKSNRRDWIIDLIVSMSTKLLSETPNKIFDVFGGSFYISHLVQVAALRLHDHINVYTNDYDGYSDLFRPETMEHLLWYKSVCDAHPELKRSELLPAEDCQRIDDYTKTFCPHLDQWVIRFFTNYGSSRHYRKRLTDSQSFWKGVNLSDYIPNTTMTLGKVDWKDWLSWIVRHEICNRSERSVWFVDPPYTTYGIGLYYGDGYDNLNIGITGIVLKILKSFPRAHVVTFGYKRNFVSNSNVYKFPRNLHYNELNEYWPACKGLRVRSRPEYTHIWYLSKENRHLENLLGMEPVIDRRNPNHIRVDGKKPNMDAWVYDDKFGSF